MRLSRFRRDCVSVQLSLLYHQIQSHFCSLWHRWDGDIDCGAGPPYCPLVDNQKGFGSIGVDAISDKGGQSRVRHYSSLKLFKDVLAIFTWLQLANIQIAVASRTTEPSWAHKALTVFAIPSGTTFSDMIKACECYDANKQRHLTAISRKLGVSKASRRVLCDNPMCVCMFSGPVVRHGLLR